MTTDQFPDDYHVWHRQGSRQIRAASHRQAARLSRLAAQAQPGEIIRVDGRFEDGTRGVVAFQVTSHRPSRLRYLSHYRYTPPKERSHVPTTVAV